MRPPAGGAESDGGVVWLSMPWQAVNRGNLGLALLSSLVAQVAPTRSLFANMWFARQIGQRRYESLQATRFTTEALFTPAAFDLRGDRLDEWMRSATPHMYEEAGLAEADAARLIRAEVPKLVDRVVREVVPLRPSVVGVSLLVSQVLPSVSVARALKQAMPEVVIVVGGSGSFGPMGAALLSSFDAFDVAVTGETGHSIRHLVEVLTSGAGIADVSGVAYRDRATGEVRVNTRTAPDHLNDLPVPDYDEYMAQFRRSGLDGDVWLPFEASRGCWWGEYNICTFCGLNAENVAYRRKSPAKVADELRTLYRRHGVTHFCASDNILPRDAGKELLPALAGVRAEVPGLRIYYQMKSSMSRVLLASLVDAGVTIVQPGIESFSDHTLTLMRKGANALSQIRALKLMTEAGVEAIYGILHGTVGETAEDLYEQAELIPALAHLIPPSYYSPISLDRFSPYAEAPAEYGIELLPPSRSDLLFPDDRVDVLGIAGAFAYRHTTPPDARIADGVAALGSAVTAWQQGYQEGKCGYATLPGPVVHVWDQRGVGPEQRMRLTGVDATVFVACDLGGSLPEVARRERLDRTEVMAAADRLAGQRLLVRRHDKAISLPTRRRTGAIIGLTGLPCAGKSTLLRTAEALGVRYLDVGAAIRTKFGEDAYYLTPADKVELLGKSLSVFSGLGPELREAYGDGGLLLVDSFKAAADLGVVRDEVPDAMVESLLITAGRDLRVTRFAERARPDDGPSLVAKEKKLAALDIDGAMRSATWTVTNDGSIEAYQRAIEEFLRSVLAALRWEDR